jgi:protein phosphatase
MEPDKNISLPEFSLVVLIGVSGSGKSTFAKSHFLPTEILSSDFFRGLVSDDENNQAATDDAFDTLHYVAAKRLANLKLTVIDATNVQAFARKSLLQLAKDHHVLPIAIVLDLPEQTCRARNANRADRNFGDHVIGQQSKQLRQSLKREGFRRIYVLKSEEEINSIEVTREKVWVNRKEETGPFDIIGDVHGCFDELKTLLEKLGYHINPDGVTPPKDRKAIFLGDLVDRGPKTPDVLKLVMSMVEAGTALCVPGNHDVRLVRALHGKKVKPTYGLSESLEQLSQESPAFKKQTAQFLDSLVSHYVLDKGQLVVAHAGMKEDLAGRTSGAVRAFAIYGETTGETDDFGLPIRYNWAADYRGTASIIYGHTPIPQPEWLNNTLNIDTGCVFGGALTALQYPEQEWVSVPAAQVYAERVRPLIPPQDTLSAQQTHDDMLDIADVLDKRRVDTPWVPNITIREDRAIPALEVMSRFTIEPKWLIYLPPTMSPPQASTKPDILEHPDEAFDYYRSQGVQQVICEEKHMGSRAVLVICKDETVSRQRFGIPNAGIGACYTRTGRRFFDNNELESTFLQRIQNAVTKSALWDELNTDWMILDCELMPWSARAQELLQNQYAAIGTAANTSLDATIEALKTAQLNGVDIGDQLTKHQGRQERMEQYITTYRHYCWPVTSLNDLKLAPFHLMATEGAVHHDKTHLWHLDTLGKLCAADPDLLFITDAQPVDLTDPNSITNATTWWEERTAKGSEGMVVKPIDFLNQGQRGLIQPAIKCRGREYLRIIYGPEYTTPEQLSQLRHRQVKHKQSMALREFALGLEGLNRFVQKEPLRRIHECVFGVLALEIEPIDPRL